MPPLSSASQLLYLERIQPLPNPCNTATPFCHSSICSAGCLLSASPFFPGHFATSLSLVHSLTLLWSLSSSQSATPQLLSLSVITYRQHVPKCPIGTASIPEPLCLIGHLGRVRPPFLLQVKALTFPCLPQKKHFFPLPVITAFPLRHATHFSQESKRTSCPSPRGFIGREAGHLFPLLHSPIVFVKTPLSPWSVWFIT